MRHLNIRALTFCSLVAAASLSTARADTTSLNTAFAPSANPKWIIDGASGTVAYVDDKKSLDTPQLLFDPVTIGIRTVQLHIESDATKLRLRDDNSSCELPLSGKKSDDLFFVFDTPNAKIAINGVEHPELKGPWLEMTLKPKGALRLEFVGANYINGKFQLSHTVLVPRPPAAHSAGVTIAKIATPSSSSAAPSVSGAMAADAEDPAHPLAYANVAQILTGKCELIARNPAIPPQERDREITAIFTPYKGKLCHFTFIVDSVAPDAVIGHLTWRPVVYISHEAKSHMEEVNSEANQSIAELHRRIDEISKIPTRDSRYSHQWYFDRTTEYTNEITAIDSARGQSLRAISAALDKMRPNQLVTIHGVTGAEKWASGQIHAVQGSILDFTYSLSHTEPAITVSSRRIRRFIGLNGEGVWIYHPDVSIQLPDSLPQPATAAETDVYVVTDVQVNATPH